MRKRILGLASGMLLGLLLLGMAGSATAAPLACDTTSFSGQVTKTGLPLTVHSADGKDRTVSAGPGLVVVRNGATAGLSDVRQGDQVNVTVPAGAADCAATRIEATSTVVAQEKDRTGLWGLLGLFGLLGLAGLVPQLRDRLRPSRRTERVDGYAPIEREARLEPVERIERVEPADEIETRPLRR
jgi:hypothetical protein